MVSELKELILTMPPLHNSYDYTIIPKENEDVAPEINRANPACSFDVSIKLLRGISIANKLPKVSLHNPSDSKQNAS